MLLLFLPGSMSMHLSLLSYLALFHGIGNRQKKSRRKSTCGENERNKNVDFKCNLNAAVAKSSNTTTENQTKLTHVHVYVKTNKTRNAVEKKMNLHHAVVEFKIRLRRLLLQ